MANIKERIREIIEESVKAKERLLGGELVNIEKAVKSIAGSLESGGKLMVFGNGGSAADSQHIVAELVGRFKKERKPLRAIALTTNTSVLTALANDYSYDITFARQVDALGVKGDVVIGISTSGNSKNVLEGIRHAKAIGIITIGIAGQDGGSLKKECDITITVDSNDTPRIQESHLVIGHIICELVEEELFKKQ